MNEANALILLGISSKPSIDELPDLIEEKVFEIRTYFLRNPVVPELFRSRERKLDQLAAAAECFGMRFEALDQLPPIVFEATELQALLQAYSQAMSSLKLRISSTLNPLHLATLTQAMVETQITFEDHFYECTEAYPNSLDQVKAADALDLGVLLFELKKDHTEAIHHLISKERSRIAARKARKQ